MNKNVRQPGKGEYDYIGNMTMEKQPLKVLSKDLLGF